MLAGLGFKSPQVHVNKRTGKDHHRYKDGWWINNGYIFIRNEETRIHPNARSDGSIAEHRFVMSNELKRPLYKGETVHHENGNKLDNSPRNLELWVSIQPAGQRPEDLVEYAKTILARYA
jgi:hypothetical protein